jgi:hypothetical protein
MTNTYPVLQELNPNCGRSTGADSLTSLSWLTLGAFAIGTEGFMIAGLLPALARDLNVGLPAAGADGVVQRGEHVSRQCRPL